MPKLIRVKDYSQAVALVDTCRDPSKGKLVASWCRIYKTIGGVAFVSDIGTQVGILTPDNMFEFTIPNDKIQNVSRSFIRASDKIMPFVWYREGSRRYFVRHKQSLRGSEVFSGLTFNYVTGEVLNPQTTDTDNIVPEARRQWLRSLKQYKQGIKVRIKMGVFDGIISEVIRERQKQTRYDWSQPDWFSDHWIDRLAQALKDQDFSLDILKGITQTAEVSYWNRHVTPEEVVITFDKITKDLSFHLRKRFGVFG